MFFSELGHLGDGLALLTPIFTGNKVTAHNTAQLQINETSCIKYEKNHLIITNAPLLFIMMAGFLLERQFIPPAIH